MAGGTVAAGRVARGGAWWRTGGKASSGLQGERDRERD